MFSMNISDKAGASTATSQEKMKLGLRISDLPKINNSQMIAEIENDMSTHRQSNINS